MKEFNIKNMREYSNMFSGKIYLLWSVIILSTSVSYCQPAEINSKNNINTYLRPEDVRLLHNNPGLIVDLGVGLWANPIPVDWDQDGDTDLLVSTTDKPSNGLYFFENDGKNVFYPGKRIAEGKRRMSVSYPDGKITVCTPELVYNEFRKQLYNNPVKIGYKQKFYSGRANQWKYADYDGDGILDLLIGAEDGFFYYLQRNSWDEMQGQ